MSVKNRLKRIVYSNLFLEKIYSIIIKKYTRGGTQLKIKDMEDILVM